MHLYWNRHSIVSIEFALHSVCAPEGILTVIHTKLCLATCGPEMHLYFTTCDQCWVPKTSSLQPPLPTVYTRRAQISHKCRSQLRIPGARWVTRYRFRTQDSQILVSTIPSSVVRATWRTSFMCPWCLLWESVKYVTSSRPGCSLLNTKQMCGKFIAVQWKRAHWSVWTLCVWLFLAASLS
jgi:hypothetical protein